LLLIKQHSIHLEGRELAPKGEAWENALAYWKTLKTDEGATFDYELTYDASQIEPQITYGTNPGLGTGITKNPYCISSKDGEASYKKSLNYMGFAENEIIGKQVDYVFLGSCTNGRIEDFRAFASIVKGRKKADNITAWLVPGSHIVKHKSKKKVS
jgi:3-isopropylmalate/(R)-2-methylmalate dehydratase large subunit